MPFVYQRTIRFQDTDAAGVVYFANLLPICHEAYEESLVAAGIELKSFFQNPAAAIPIVHASVDFLRPMVCGDRLLVHLTPQPLTGQTFEIHYAITRTGTEQRISNALTRHICINPQTRSRQDLPTQMLAWLRQWSTAADTRP